jgi:hypothetical protein
VLSQMAPFKSMEKTSKMKILVKSLAHIGSASPDSGCTICRLYPISRPSSYMVSIGR